MQGDSQRGLGAGRVAVHLHNDRWGFAGGKGSAPGELSKPGSEAGGLRPFVSPCLAGS